MKGQLRDALLAVHRMQPFPCHRGACAQHCGLGRIPINDSQEARKWIQGSERSLAMARYDLTDFEWKVIKPLLPNKPRGVPRVDDRRVLNGIFWVLRSGAPWADVPERYGPPTTIYNRFNRWRKA